MKDRTFVGVQGRGQLVLPADLRRRHHLDEAGAQVEIIERDDGVIELRPQVPIPADQRWFWEESWQAGERAVSRHVAAGRLKVSKDADQFLADMDRVRGSKPRKRAGG